MESLDSYLQNLASGDPVPGGGSAASVIGAIAAALVAMVGRIAACAPADLSQQADELRAQLMEARGCDEQAYAAVVAAQALPKADDSQRMARRVALDTALKGAAQAPLAAAKLALGVLELVERLLDLSMGALVSDVACAAEFAYAAVTACGYNVRINHRYMRDETLIREQAAELVRIEGRSAEILLRARRAVASRR
ncbi:MAG: cyclodeaminase/cyclohydrolase family protein [Candidatus Eremiobacteraeota bacterium]|nr:cyclodeaminase/cyclohydrolase family protein [Candidatus Eremiobacteraeota bacterium]